MTMSEIQNLLNSLMRSIDKKTALTVEVSPDTSRPAVIVRLSCDKRTGSLQITEADLVAGQTDLARRNRVRSALKRARDRMWEEAGYIFSTKVENSKSEGTQWFRPMQRGRGRR
jgi:hypothetical protein